MNEVLQTEGRYVAQNYNLQWDFEIVEVSIQPIFQDEIIVALRWKTKPKGTRPKFDSVLQWKHQVIEGNGFRLEYDNDSIESYIDVVPKFGDMLLILLSPKAEAGNK